jgi:alpha-L-fucosidase
MRKLALLILTFALAPPAVPQTAPTDGAAHQRLQWWTQARFGMFIHWGLYSIPAGVWDGKPVPGLGEWIMHNAKIPVRDYEKLAAQFDPVDFNADQWVAIAKNAGAKYITITAKHHDGFAMFGSKVTPYNIVDATPFHRDPMKELAAACRRAGIRLCFYYSQSQDWHEPDAIGNTWDFPDESKKDFQKYFNEKVLPQVKELLTNYGPLGLIWFDTPRNISEEDSRELVDLVHRLQPNCLVSGRVGNGLGDYDEVGDNQITVGNVKRPWETPVTINDTWGFKKDDHNWKSVTTLIHQLATTSSRGGNYLLNVGPTSLGVIPPPSVERLAAIGKWMKANGDAIYATSASLFPYDFEWGVITTKPGRMYLHVFHWPGRRFEMYGLLSKVRRAYLLANHSPVRMAQSTDKTNCPILRLRLPAEAPDPNDSVIVLELEGNAEVDPSLRQQPDRSVTLAPHLGDLHKSTESPIRMDSRGVIEHWTDAHDWIDWNFKVNHPGVFNVELVTSQQKYGKGWDGGQKVTLQLGADKLSGAIADNGHEDNPANPYWPYVVSRLGSLKISKPGAYTLSLKPDEIPGGQKYGLTLVSVRLLPK